MGIQSQIQIWIDGIFDLFSFALLVSFVLFAKILIISAPSAISAGQNFPQIPPNAQICISYSSNAKTF